jgi:hypothetical protein
MVELSAASQPVPGREVVCVGVGDGKIAVMRATAGCGDARDADVAVEPGAGTKSEFSMPTM